MPMRFFIIGLFKRYVFIDKKFKTFSNQTTRVKSKISASNIENCFTKNFGKINNLIIPVVGGHFEGKKIPVFLLFFLYLTVKSD